MWARTDATVGHARQFDVTSAPADHLTPADLEPLGRSAVDFLGYVLLDMATVDDEIHETAFAAALVVSAELAIADRFDELAADELELSRSEVTRLRASAGAVLHAAERA